MAAREGRGGQALTESYWVGQKVHLGFHMMSWEKNK